MRRTVSGSLIALVLAAAGCGQSEERRPEKELNDLQQASQKQADDDERAMQKEQKKKK
jgi:hypothetical protein